MKASMKAILTACVISFLVGYVSFADNEEDLKSGKEALERGDLPKAIQLLREVTKSDKKNPEGFILFGTALYKADSLEQAIGALVLARELAPNNAAIYTLLGDVYTKQKFIAIANEQYKRSFELDSTKVDVAVKLAEGYRKQRQYNDAALYYIKALRIDSTNVTSLRELGSIYFKAKQYANAALFLEKLVRLQPDSLTYQIMYVKSLHEIKRCKEIIPVAESILKKDASFTDIQTILAEAYDCTGQTDSLLKIFDKLNHDSMSVDQLLRYGKLLKVKEQLDEAEEIYKKASRKDSMRCDIPYDFGTLYMKLKKYRDAVRMFEKKIACDTSAGYQFASHLNSAMSLMQLKEFKVAKDHVQKSIEYRPDNIQAWQTLAECFGLMEQITDAMAAYKKVIELAAENNTNGDEGKYNSQLHEAYYFIGVHLLIDATKDKDTKTNKAKYAVAAEYLKKALLYDSKDCETFYYAGVAFQNSNNKEEAVRYYRKYLETCPKDKHVEEVKGHVKSLGE